LQAHPCRASINKILDQTKLKKDLAPEPASTKKHLIVTTIIIILSYLVAITISQLDLVLSFVGSTGSTTISFILPGLFYFKLYSDKKWHWKRMIALFLTIYGVTVMTVCLTFNIKRLL
jgi:amino acid permease